MKMGCADDTGVTNSRSMVACAVRHRRGDQHFECPAVVNVDRDTLVAMRIFFFLLCCQLVAGAGAAREPDTGNVSRPRVFLITIDTLRADHVHCYGYEGIRTPALDLLAEQGIRFM